MNIRTTPEWQAIRADLGTNVDITDAIYNALARHKAECHGIEDATNPVADLESVARMDAPPPIPDGYCLVKREDVQEAVYICREYAAESMSRSSILKLAARLEAAAKGDDGWRERCEIGQNHRGHYVFVEIEGYYHFLTTAGRWIDGGCFDGYFPTEQAARDALAKAPKPEGV